MSMAEWDYVRRLQEERDELKETCELLDRSLAASELKRHELEAELERMTKAAFDTTWSDTASMLLSQCKEEAAKATKYHKALEEIADFAYDEPDCARIAREALQGQEVE